MNSYVGMTGMKRQQILHGSDSGCSGMRLCEMKLTPRFQLANRKIKSLNSNLDEIKDIVAANAKQRFSLIHISEYDTMTNTASPLSSIEPATSPLNTYDTPTSVPTDSAPLPTIPENTNHTTTPHNDSNPTNYFVRANQGHSIKLAEEDMSDLLTPITLEANNLPATVVHGTRHEHWAKILASGGLKTMGRTHVHFAVGVPEVLRSAFQGKGDDVSEEPDEHVATLPPPSPTAQQQQQQPPEVKSGMRNSSTLLIFINLPLALSSGLKFYISANGVVLSAGNEEKGVVGIEFFEKVEERGGRVLVRDGKMIADAVMAVGRGGGVGRDREGRGRGGRGR